MDPEGTEKVILNGKIYTVDDQNPWAQAVAISGNRITAVGTNTEIQNLITQNTEIIDAEGRLVLPGFFDAHCHPTAYVCIANGLDVFGCDAPKDYQETIANYRNSNPGLSLIKGVGWLYSDFEDGFPHKKILDEVCPDIPIMLYSGDLHAMWVNSKTLEVAGITNETPNPPGGCFERDKNGDLNGYINELPAIQKIEEQLSKFSAADYKRGVQYFFERAKQVGITSIHDAELQCDEALAGYRDLREDEYSLRVMASHAIYDKEGLDIAAAINGIEDLKALRNEYYSCNCIKLFMDGVPEANTAVLEEAYINEPDNRGTPLWNMDRFKALCAKADGMGLQIHVHAIGDRAVRLTLDGLEYAEKQNGKRDSRHLIAHLQLTNDHDLTRIRDLNATVVPTAFWFEKGEMYYKVELNNLGKARADLEYKMKSFFDRGIRVACGSDGPVGIGKQTGIPFNPLVAIQQGITRCSVSLDCHDPENVLNSQESASLDHMLRAYTINCAAAHFKENELGSITPGKKADIIILSKNLFEIPADQIYTSEVLLTIFDGKVIFDKKIDK